MPTRKVCAAEKLWLDIPNSQDTTSNDPAKYSKGPTGSAKQYAEYSRDRQTGHERPDGRPNATSER
jgi:hypothetical protein